MSINLHVGNASGELDHLIKTINDAYQVANKKINQIFGDQNIDIFILNELYHVIPEYGFGGFTPSKDIVYINVDKKAENINLQLLTSIMLHEIHHAIRWKGVGYGETLGEALISEGLATYFEFEFMGSVPIYANVELSTKIVSRAKDEISLTDYDHNAWFYGSKTIPRWSGYTLGFQMAQKYFKDHGINDMDAVCIDASKVIGYYFSDED